MEPLGGLGHPWGGSWEPGGPVSRCLNDFWSHGGSLLEPNPRNLIPQTHPRIPQTRPRIPGARPKPRLPMLIRPQNDNSQIEGRR